jgi:hypothetical protein
MSKSFIVRMRCKVLKDVVCEGCTEKQARNDPFEYAIDEVEVEQEDWEVISVKEDK